MLETRVSRYKKKRDKIVSDTILEHQANNASDEIQKIRKNMERISKKYGSLSRFAGIESKNISTFEPIKTINTDHLFSKVDVAKLDQVINSIKSATNIPGANNERTEMMILKQAVNSKEITSLIGDKSDGTSSITKIISELELSQDNRELTNEREKVAIEELKIKIDRIKEKVNSNPDNPFGDDFDEETILRLKKLSEKKLSEKHYKRTMMQLLIILSLIFLVMWLLYFMLQDIFKLF